MAGGNLLKLATEISSELNLDLPDSDSESIVSEIRAMLQAKYNKQNTKEAGSSRSASKGEDKNGEGKMVVDVQQKLEKKVKSTSQATVNSSKTRLKGSGAGIKKEHREDSDIFQTATKDLRYLSALVNGEENAEEETAKTNEDKTKEICNGEEVKIKQEVVDDEEEDDESININEVLDPETGLFIYVPQGSAEDGTRMSPEREVEDFPEEKKDTDTCDVPESEEFDWRTRDGDSKVWAVRPPSSMWWVNRQTMNKGRKRKIGEVEQCKENDNIPTKFPSLRCWEDVSDISKWSQAIFTQLMTKVNSVQGIEKSKMNWKKYCPYVSMHRVGKDIDEQPEHSEEDKESERQIMYRFEDSYIPDKDVAKAFEKIPYKQKTVVSNTQQIQPDRVVYSKCGTTTATKEIMVYRTDMSVVKLKVIPMSETGAPGYRVVHGQSVVSVRRKPLTATTTASSETRCTVSDSSTTVWTTTVPTMSSGSDQLTNQKKQKHKFVLRDCLTKGLTPKTEIGTSQINSNESKPILKIQPQEGTTTAGVKGLTNPTLLSGAGFPKSVGDSITPTTLVPNMSMVGNSQLSSTPPLLGTTLSLNTIVTNSSTSLQSATILSSSAAAAALPTINLQPPGLTSPPKVVIVPENPITAVRPFSRALETNQVQVGGPLSFLNSAEQSIIIASNPLVQGRFILPKVTRAPPGMPTFVTSQGLRFTLQQIPNPVGCAAPAKGVVISDGQTVASGPTVAPATKQLRVLINPPKKMLPAAPSKTHSVLAAHLNAKPADSIQSLTCKVIKKEPGVNPQKSPTATPSVAAEQQISDDDFKTTKEITEFLSLHILAQIHAAKSVGVPLSTVKKMMPALGDKHVVSNFPSLPTSFSMSQAADSLLSMAQANIPAALSTATHSTTSLVSQQISSTTSSYSVSADTSATSSPPGQEGRKLNEEPSADQSVQTKQKQKTSDSKHHSSLDANSSNTAFSNMSSTLTNDGLRLKIKFEKLDDESQSNNTDLKQTEVSSDSAAVLDSSSSSVTSNSNPNDALNQSIKIKLEREDPELDALHGMQAGTEPSEQVGNEGESSEGRNENENNDDDDEFPSRLEIDLGQSIKKEIVSETSDVDQSEPTTQSEISKSDTTSPLSQNPVSMSDPGPPQNPQTSVTPIPRFCHQLITTGRLLLPFPKFQIDQIVSDASKVVEEKLAGNTPFSTAEVKDLLASTVASSLPKKKKEPSGSPDGKLESKSSNSRKPGSRKASKKPKVDLASLDASTASSSSTWKPFVGGPARLEPPAFSIAARRRNAKGPHNAKGNDDWSPDPGYVDTLFDQIKEEPVDVEAIDPEELDHSAQEIVSKLTSGFNVLPYSDVKKTVTSTGNYWECPLCKKRFTRNYTFKRHAETHSGIRRFQCDVCGKAFTDKRYLFTHKRWHSGKNLKYCDICTRPFADELGLKKHMRLHSGENTCFCKKCDKAFSDRSTLRRHVLNVHEGVKPFKCGICHHAFVFKSHLEDHMRRHTGERPYPCATCGRSFIQIGTRNRHEKVHCSKRNLKSCHICKKLFKAEKHYYMHMFNEHDISPDTMAKIASDMMVPEDIDQIKNEDVTWFEMEIDEEEDEEELAVETPEGTLELDTMSQEELPT